MGLVENAWLGDELPPRTRSSPWGSLNVLVDNNRVLIADFGLSKVRKDSNSVNPKSGWGNTQGHFGTIAFMSPELLDGQPLRPPADVYAFAMMFYEVLSGGRMPFQDQPGGIGAVVYKVVVQGARPDRPAIHVSEKVWGLVKRCWEQLPTDRPDFVTVRRELTEVVASA